MRPCFACFASASGSRSRRGSVATLRTGPHVWWSLLLWSFLLLPCLCCPRSKHYRRRVRSPLTKPIARPPCRRSCRSSELLALSCSCRLDALVRLTELTELTALMPSSGQLRSTCASSYRLTATLRPPLQRTPSLPWIHVVTRIAPPCFTRLRFQLRLSSRDPQDSAKRVRQTRSIGAAWLGCSG